MENGENGWKTHWSKSQVYLSGCGKGQKNEEGPFGRRLAGNKKSNASPSPHMLCLQKGLPVRHAWGETAETEWGVGGKK